MHLTLALSVLLSLRRVASHAAIWHPSMFGFNVTDHTFPYDNRPVAPMVNYSYTKWWFHGHLDYPPHPDDVFELPAGQPATMQIGCNKGATTYYGSSEGGNIQNASNPEDVCPGSSSTQYHTTGIDDVRGCALAIAYKSNVSDVQPEDFTVFSVNQTCVWYRYTVFPVPARMPPCPNGQCICSFFWIHDPNSGSEQMYMNGFQCNVTGSTSSVSLATPQLARRCGADPDDGKPNTVWGNCTYGAKQPFYWLQAERNNMHEGYYKPPYYSDLYNFQDGAQDDIFQDSYKSIPVPGPNQTALPDPRPSWVPSSISASAAVNTASGAASPAVADLGGEVLAASSTPTALNSATQLASSTPTASTDATPPSSTPSDSGSQCGVEARSASTFSRRHAERAKARLSSREEWEI